MGPLGHGPLVQRATSGWRDGPWGLLPGLGRVWPLPKGLHLEEPGRIPPHHAGQWGWADPRARQPAQGLAARLDNLENWPRCMNPVG